MKKKNSNRDIHSDSPQVFLPCLLSLFSNFPPVSIFIFVLNSVVSRLKCHTPFPRLLGSQKLLNEIIWTGSNNHPERLLKYCLSVELYQHLTQSLEMKTTRMCHL